MKWYNEPVSFSETKDGTMTVQVPGKTDYWRVTLHHFVRDDAPFYYDTVSGDFEARVKITGQYRSLYDQAGLMVRQDETVWMKCGIEYFQDQQQASTVVTRDYSDWSILPLQDNPSSVWFKVKRTGETIETFYSIHGEDGKSSYTQLRQAYLSKVDALDVGIMCAAPQGDGFQVVFDKFYITKL